MELRIRDFDEKEKDVCEFWLGKGISYITLYSQRNGDSCRTEFTIRDDGSWIKIPLGNLSDQSENSLNELQIRARYADLLIKDIPDIGTANKWYHIFAEELDIPKSIVRDFGSARNLKDYLELFDRIRNGDI